MEKKKKPKLVLIGMEQNKEYMTMFQLYERRDMTIKCHCIQTDEKKNTKELVCRVNEADMILIVVGSMEEYRYFKPMASILRDRCIFILDVFEGRTKCLRKFNKNLMVEGKGKIGEVVSELIAIMVLDDSTMLDYTDVFHCAGWRTVVRNDIYRDADEALDKKEMYDTNDRKEISLLWFHGELDCCSVVEVTKMVWHEEEMKQSGASYEDGVGFGILSFVRDRDDPTEQKLQIVNPFKKQPIKWLMLGCLVLTLICVVLGIRLVTLQNEREQATGLIVAVKDDECGVEIRTIKSTMADEQGNEVVSCKEDVVTVYGAEYELVAKVIEEQFSLRDMQKTLEMLRQFGNGACFESWLECRRLDGKIISFKDSIHYYTGGGGFLSEGYTFSVEEGKLLMLDELLMDEKGFYSEIDLLIQKALSRHPDIIESQVDYEKKYQELYITEGRLPDWVLSADGITFLFEQGDFLAMMYGCIEVTVPYGEVEGYIKKEYR